MGLASSSVSWVFSKFNIFLESQIAHFNGGSATNPIYVYSFLLKLLNGRTKIQCASSVKKIACCGPEWKSCGYFGFPGSVLGVEDKQHLFYKPKIKTRLDTDGMDGDLLVYF